ncbi:hypothetical protein HD595_002585 [Nonomuraea roseoviolacea subsp. carminata]|uniref:Uncharacterized protein n=1 Tax=Nonomuraea roseoviolacea subsp. carminata TaxID=160689 RepID=A0ABT1JXH0_9ACTN|nr:hypothetical protein [Nonomuraea roseoviolacea subsp. carminata]
MRRRIVAAVLTALISVGIGAAITAATAAPASANWYCC